ncbi:hypothetical protein HXX76_014681 [Chlamydomonas incerta]|uniref:Uncharacterized protein n=1 Tax=Chlamydomonas incerta TaxID=51695 RepID=A0A835SBB7_CHLIN|nr:hypothetical protein HXX76_014681 [Chlamydomonas incerta]|eukprot:KAG2424148.1 hypothetical protein HXX76_014681 [Chlamydomonas incerta]
MSARASVVASVVAPSTRSEQLSRLAKGHTHSGPKGPKSDKAKAATSEAMKGVPKSEAHKAVMSECRKGIPKTDKAKAAMSEVAKRRRLY